MSNSSENVKDENDSHHSGYKKNTNVSVETNASKEVAANASSAKKEKNCIKPTSRTA